MNTPKLPPLPEWAKMDNLGGLVPSEIRQELRAYAIAAIAAQGVPDGWQPIETAPENMDECVVVGWLDDEGLPRTEFDYKEDGCWIKWHEHAEHTEIIGGHGVSYTPPYTHWLKLPPLAPQADKAQSLPSAMKTVIAAMKEAPDYAWSWHCNVAMAFVDAGGDAYTANQGAARFMRLLAGVEPAYELPLPQAKSARRPSADWYKAKIMETLDDDFNIGPAPQAAVTYQEPPQPPGFNPGWPWPEFAVQQAAGAQHLAASDPVAHQQAITDHAADLETRAEIAEQQVVCLAEERDHFKALYLASKQAGVVQQEPVAWKHDCAVLLTNNVELWVDACPHCGKPRTHPAQQAKPQPLSDEQLLDGWDKSRVCTGSLGSRQMAFNEGARFAEAAHGIKE